MDFSIKCKVLYNPEVWWWTWTFRVDGKEYELRSDEDPGYTHSDIVPRSKVRAPHSEKYLVRLILTRVQDEKVMVCLARCDNLTDTLG